MRGRTEILNPGTFSNPVQFADGTAALPSITFASDTDTGFWHDASNTFTATLGGASAVRFLFDGIMIQGTTPGLLAWAAGDPTSTSRDTAFGRGAAATVYFGNGSLADNTGIFGDATHRVSNIHTRSLTLGQTLANATVGEVTLSGAGSSAIIYSSAITATSTTRIFLSKVLMRPASGAGVGAVGITTSIAGVSATIASTTTGDTSVVSYWIVPTS